MMKYFLTIVAVIWYTTNTYTQTLHFRAGATQATLDWRYVEVQGPRPDQQYKAPLTGYAVGLGVEYFDKGLFSLSSDLWYYRSGGQFTDEEKAQRPTAGSVGFADPEQLLVEHAAFSTCLNFNPLHGKAKLQVQMGPRIDLVTDGTAGVPLNFVQRRDGLNRVNYGFNLGMGFYLSGERWQYGVQATWLSRLRKLVDLDPEITRVASFVGATADEQIFALQVSLGYRLK